MKILADELLAQPRGHDDACSVTQCTLPICKYYKQCSFNCIELGFFYDLNKIEINLRYVDAIHWLKNITIRRFIAYKPPKCEINAACSSSVYYMDKGILLGTKTLVLIIRHYIRELSGVFSVCHA
jgi:hypothetical protein